MVGPRFNDGGEPPLSDDEDNTSGLLGLVFVPWLSPPTETGAGKPVGEPNDDDTIELVKDGADVGPPPLDGLLRLVDMGGLKRTGGGVAGRGPRTSGPGPFRLSAPSHGLNAGSGAWRECDRTRGGGSDERCTSRRRGGPRLIDPERNWAWLESFELTITHYTYSLGWVVDEPLNIHVSVWFRLRNSNFGSDRRLNGELKGILGVSETKSGQFN